MERKPLIGIAIAVHNGIKKTRECIIALKNSSYEKLYICVVDDGSTDNTQKILRNEFPDVKIIHGSGNLWWAGGTNLAIKKCLIKGCDFIMLLNPDCFVEKETINELINCAYKFPRTIVAPIVVDKANPSRIWWAGTRWKNIKGIPFIWILRNIYKPGTKVDYLPSDPFRTSETTGRGILIPRHIFYSVGLLDEKIFPHYGADNDYGLRVNKHGNKILVLPRAKVCIDIKETGLNLNPKFTQLLFVYYKRLLFKKHGKSIYCAWFLLRRYAPTYAVIPSIIFWHVVLFVKLFTSSLYNKKCKE